MKKALIFLGVAALVASNLFSLYTANTAIQTANTAEANLRLAQYDIRQLQSANTTFPITYRSPKSSVGPRSVLRRSSGKSRSTYTSVRGRSHSVKKYGKRRGSSRFSYGRRSGSTRSRSRSSFRRL